MVTKRLASHEKIPLLNTNLRPGTSDTGHDYPIDRYLKMGDRRLNLSRVWEKYDFKPYQNAQEGQALTELQAILKSTTEELKEISMQLTKSHEISLRPRGFSQKYNQYAHVENIVKSKLYNPNKTNKINNKALPFKQAVDRVKSNIRAIAKNVNDRRDTPTKVEKKSTDASVQANLSSGSESKPSVQRNFSVLNRNLKKSKKASSIGYDHIKSCSMEEKNGAIYNNLIKSKNLVVQNIPGISIRHELKEQKLPSLHISPDMKQQPEVKSNVKFIDLDFNQPTSTSEVSGKVEVRAEQKEEVIGSIVDMYKNALYKTNTQVVEEVLKTIGRTQKKVKCSPKCTTKKSRQNVTPKPMKIRTMKKRNEAKKDLKSDRSTRDSHASKNVRKSDKFFKVPEIRTPDISAEYIPYAQLTLGGVSAEDLEKEIDSVDNKSDVLLSPIVHRILSSKTEVDTHDNVNDSVDSHPKHVLSKSDELMLKEMIDLDNKIQKTLLAAIVSPNDFELSNEPSSVDPTISESVNKATESYADDFEEVCDQESSQNEENHGLNEDHQKVSTANENIENKMSRLSLKGSIEIFEFLPLPNKIDESSQSQTQTNQRETQTSPSYAECEKMPTAKRSEEFDVLKLGDRDIIKYLIKEECENILDSKNLLMANNVPMVQKCTQTSYNEEKSLAVVPTSTLDKPCSPISIKNDTSSSKLSDKVPVEGAECGLSLNSSSPRFQLQLPSSCLEYFSKLDTSSSTSPISKKTDGSKNSNI